MVSAVELDRSGIKGWEKRGGHGGPFMFTFRKSIRNNTKGAMVAQSIIRTLVGRLLQIPTRLHDVVSAYLLMLMLEAAKHTQTFAESVTGKDQTRFSALLNAHKDLAVDSLRTLAKASAKEAAKGRPLLVSGAKWTVALIIDATLHPRSSLHCHNAQRFNHGQGFVIGHQWTNIVLRLAGRVIPLPPIPFWSRNECKRRGVAYKTEHERLKDYLAGLNLAELLGEYDPAEIVVLTDSGYDDKKLQTAVLSRGWDFVGALKTPRGIKTEADHANGTKTWRRIDDLFWAARKQSPWQTVRVETDGGKKRRRFRARRLTGYLKGVGPAVTLVCSEKSGGTGRRYFACSRPDLDQGIIVRAYSIRWEVELFHRATKHQFGLLDAGVQDFDALTAHVHWVYCAYLLLHEIELSDAQSLLDKQRRLTKLAHQAPWERRLQKIAEAKTQFGGRARQDRLVAAALQDAKAS